MNRPVTILISAGAGLLLLAAATTAGAATGANFILGKVNSETTQATLNNSKGTPLSLVAPAGAAPLKVSNSRLVGGLNAQYLGGLTGQDLATGGHGATTNTTIPLTNTAQEIVSTGSLPAGLYYATATALMNITASGNAGNCWLIQGSGASAVANGTSGVGTGEAVETAAVNVTAGDNLQEWCFGASDTGSVVLEAEITAIRVLSSNVGAGTGAGARHSTAAPPSGPAPPGR